MIIFTIIGIVVVVSAVLLVIACFSTDPDDTFDDSKLHGK